MPLRRFYNASIVKVAPQSSPARIRPPILLAALSLCLAGASALAAQDVARAVNPGPFHRNPTGIQLGSVLVGAPLILGDTSGDWREVTIEGWIWTASTRADRREGFDISVSASPTENLRAEPNGTIVARLGQGALLERLATSGGWTRVRRTGWVPSRLLPAGPATPEVETIVQPREVELFEAASETGLYLAPDGQAQGALAEGATGEVVARAGEWVRVRVEGWVREEAIASAESPAQVGVSAAEVRANPERYLGQLLEWRLQFVALQQADELRPEIPVGEYYLLTRGPEPEAGFVYVTIPQDQLDRFRAMQPLQDLTLRVQVMAAKTRYLPNPVVRLVEVVATENL